MSASVSRYSPLAIAQFIDGVVQSYLPAPEQFVMASYFPTRLSPTTKVEWDISMPLYGGLVRPTSRGAESSILKGGGRKRAFVEAVHFREKYRFDQEETVAIRRMGTLDQFSTPQELLAEKSLWLRRRTQTRMEWAGWKAIFGQVLINENGVNEVYNFPIPSYLDVTLDPADQWDQAGSSPINDVMEAMDLTQRYSYRWSTMWMNAETAKTVVQNQQFFNFISSTLSNYSAGQIPGGMGMNLELANDIINRFMPLAPKFRVFDGRYELQYPITTLAVVGANNLVLDEVNHIEVGDEVVIEAARAFNTQLSTVVAVNPNNMQIALADPLDYAFEPGAVVHVSKPYIPDGKVVFLPEIGSGQGVPEFGATYLCPTVFNPGTLMSPKPGVFSELQMHEDQDPKFADLIEGYEGATVLKRPEARAIYTVF